MALAGPSSSVIPYQHADLAQSSLRSLRTILWGGIAGGVALVLWGVTTLAEWGAFVAWPIVRPASGARFFVDRSTWLQGDGIILAGVIMVVTTVAVLAGRIRLSVAWLLVLLASVLLAASQAAQAAHQYQFRRQLQGFQYLSAVGTEWSHYALPVVWPATLAFALRCSSADENDRRKLRALRAGGSALGILILLMSGLNVVGISRRIGWATCIAHLSWEMRTWIVTGAVVTLACAHPTLTVRRCRQLSFLAFVLLCMSPLLGWLSLLRPDVAQRLEMVYGPQWWVLEALLIGTRCLVTSMPMFVLFVALRREAVATRAATA